MNKEFNVLIVDDNRELASNIMDILKIRDYRTVAAFNGESALKIAEDTVFHLGLIDLKLPDMTGIDVIRKISAFHPQMEFIVISGHGTFDVAAEAVSMKSILAFENKPVDIDRLLMLIEQVIKRRKLEMSLKDSEERYRNLIDNSVTGINIVQEEKIRFCNKRMAEIFGYDTPEELVGKGITDLLHRDDLDLVREMVKRRLDGGENEVRYECRGIKKDGSEIFIEVLGTVIRYGNSPAVQGAVLDITRRKAAEMELEGYQKNLEEKISERTEELARKNEELQKFNKLFIGREKRIKELKEMISELQGKVKEDR